MARPGISYLDVAKTAIKLVEQKIHPSIEEIRKALGTGSNSTINKYLREWRNKHGNQAELEQGLPEALLLAVRGIYEGIKEEATLKINSIETESKNAISELKAKLIEVDAEHARFLQANKLLENNINMHKEENSALQRQFNKLEVEFTKKTDSNSILQERLDDKKQEIVTLKQQLKNTQDNLEHYREKVRQTRETENNLLDEQIKSLERQLYQQQSISHKVTEETTILLRQIKSLEDNKNAILQQLNEAMTNIQEQRNILQQQTIIHNELSEKYNNLLSENIRLEHKLNSGKEAVITSRINLEKSQERIVMLTDALEKTETKVAFISDKNLFLTQEKSELAFQLKQLQSCKQ